MVLQKTSCMPVTASEVQKQPSIAVLKDFASLQENNCNGAFFSRDVDRTFPVNFANFPKQFLIKNYGCLLLEVPRKDAFFAQKIKFSITDFYSKYD